MGESVFEELNKSVDVSRETYDRLSLYHDLLLKWQSKINLVGPDTVSDAWRRHFLDSLQLIKYLPSLSSRIVDLGSGAGFPGMVLSVAGAHDVHLIESDGKKISFLREVARITKTQVNIHHKRIEDRPVSDADVIVSRACSDLASLLKFSSLYVSRETICLFHKGKNYSKDISDANEHWMFDCQVIPSVTDAQGAILKLTDLRKRGL